MITAAELSKKQDEILESINTTKTAEATQICEELVLGIVDKINQGYGAKMVQYRILGGNVYKPDNESWFNLDTMHYVCKVLREADYKANVVYDKTDCNGTLTISW